MLRNRGAAWALASLIALIGIGSSYSWITSENKHYSNTVEHRVSSVNKESVQDIAAETVACYTEVLAWFTGILAFVSAIQIGFLIKADKTAKTTASAALAAAQAAQSQAAEMGKTSDIAQTQLAILADQNDTLKKQHGIGRLQYFAANPPQFIVRGLALLRFEEGAPIVVRITVINRGASEGVVTEGNVTIFTAREGVLEPIAPYDSDKTVLVGTKLPSGGKTNLSKETARFAFNWETDSVARRMGSILYVFGYFAYRGEDDIVREIGFCCRYDPDAKRFSVVDDPNYSYQT